LDVFTINIPQGTAIWDRHGQQHTDRALNLHVVAENWELGVKLIRTCYATHIGEDQVKAFQPQKSTASGMVFLELVGRASDVSGSIVIEGGVFSESEERIEAFIYAGEAGKFRWIQLRDEGGERDGISAWAILDSLHAIF
jgi:hypothetical protein